MAIPATNSNLIAPNAYINFVADVPYAGDWTTGNAIAVTITAQMQLGGLDIEYGIYDPVPNVTLSPLTIVIDGNNIWIFVATDSGGIGTSTCGDVVAAIQGRITNIVAITNNPSVVVPIPNPPFDGAVANSASPSGFSADPPIFLGGGTNGPDSSLGTLVVGLNTSTAAEFVQSFSAATDGTSLEGSFTSDNIAGNCIVVYVSASFANPSLSTLTNDAPLISDTQGNVYTFVGSVFPTAPFSSVSGGMFCWVATNVIAGPNTITAEILWFDYMDMVATEYSGVSTTVPIDCYATNVGNSDNSSVGVTYNGILGSGTAQAGELLVVGVFDSTAYINVDSGNDVFSILSTPAETWTQREESVTNVITNLAMFDSLSVPQNIYDITIDVIPPSPPASGGTWVQNPTIMGI